MKEIDKEAMEIAIEESEKNKKNDYTKGGPFGCAIVKDNKIIATGHNTVVQSKDPTAHAEINAIRKACKEIDYHDLSGCVLYTSAEPCPMCLSAIIWANIKEVYYANTKEEVDEIGFRDDDIYDYLQGKNKKFIKLKHVKSEEASEVFDEFKEIENKKMY